MNNDFNMPTSKEMHAPTMTDINQLTGSLTDRDEHWGDDVNGAPDWHDAEATWPIHVLLVRAGTGMQCHISTS